MPKTLIEPFRIKSIEPIRMTTRAERERLLAEMNDIQAQVTRLEGLLSSSFAQKAPAAVVDKERQKLATYQDTVAKFKTQLESLGE